MERDSCKGLERVSSFSTLPSSALSPSFRFSSSVSFDDSYCWRWKLHFHNRCNITIAPLSQAETAPLVSSTLLSGSRLENHQLSSSTTIFLTEWHGVKFVDSTFWIVIEHDRAHLESKARGLRKTLFKLQISLVSMREDDEGGMLWTTTTPSKLELICSSPS